MIENFILLDAQYPWAAYFIAFLFGSAIGSFLNVVVYRLPIMLSRDWHDQAVEIIEETNSDPELSRLLKATVKEQTEPFNLVLPNSRCPGCGAAIRPWHNIPVLGYLLLGGKCADCKTSISIRYPIIEFTTALLTMLVIMEFGVSWQGLAACTLTWGLIALALIDFDTQLLPDDITLLFLWLGLSVNFFYLFTSLSQAFLGAAAGYLIFWSVYQLFKLVTGKEGMGYGDFKMLAMLGAWLGLSAVPLIIVLSSFAGAVIGGLLIATGWSRDKPIKFGPFLAVAGWIALMWGNDLISMYLEFALRDV
ncbi:MAG: prepilin peptidase [Gammaproteobacteria bacterium]|jgi:leader peptidase (prepilin peptidase) / N-methyltransferase|nr:prepilin peptidase [Gammaproteobacteria bacterium]MBT4494934.1 prepilin peptidase [Gammaproteobacteria bacterium]